MKIGIVKPDYKIYGGFEVVVDKLKEELMHEGYDIDIIKVDMTERSLSNNDIRIPEEIYNQNPEYFKYLLSFEKFKRLDLKSYDCIISTQPPSFCISHPKNIVLFYHHMKIYYDLYDVFMEVGLVDKHLHSLAAKYVREVDNDYLNDSKYYAVGSNHIKDRLIKYNGITKNLDIFYAGIDDEYYNYEGQKAFKYPICVGRHEFPKRVELFIQSMKYCNTKGLVIGSGGRIETLRELDMLLTYNHVLHKKETDSTRLWKEIFFKINDFNINDMKRALKEKNINSNVEFTGKVNKSQLINHYANALCVVCPAYEEDYGLTAIEAMAFGKPVIACTDGGGYKELIEDGKTGFIVEPKGKAIADAINFLIDNPQELKKMSNNAFEESRKFSWKNSISKFTEILNKCMEE